MATTSITGNEKPQTEEDGIPESEFPYITFSVEETLYAINSKHTDCVEIIESFTKMPKTPDYVLGIAAFRDTYVPLFNVRTIFGVPDESYGDNVIILRKNNTLCGLVVDKIISNDLLDSFEDAFDNNKFVQKIGGEKDSDTPIMILNYRKFFEVII